MERDPLETFRRWLTEAERAGLPEPTAMHLATAGADGAPAGRMVLLKGLDERGFVFYTNYESAKGRHLAANARAALTFHWQPLGHQVRVSGPVRKVSAAESDAYFAGRPLGSRLGAWASRQSDVIESRAALEDAVGAVAARWPGGDVPRPPWWGGYRVRHQAVEFWTHRDDRLHERVRYTRRRGRWAVDLLSP